MIVQLSAIGTHCGAPSTGYLVRLLLIRMDEIAVGLIEATASVSLAGAAKVYEFPLRTKNAAYSESPGSSANGDSYSLQLSLSYLAANNTELAEWAEAQGQRRWVAIFQTTTGDVFLGGDQEHGLKLSVSRSATERHLLGLTLSGPMPHRLYRLPSSNPAVLFPAHEVVAVATNCGIPSSGYLTHLYVLSLEDILYTQEPTTGYETAIIWPINDASVFQLPLRVKTATYSENPQEDQGGLSYALTLSTFYHAVNNAEITYWAELQGQKRFAAIFRTVTGDFFLGGDSQHGLKLNVARSATEKHLISLSLTGSVPHRLWRLESVDPTVLFAIIDFSSTDFSSTDFSQ